MCRRFEHGSGPRELRPWQAARQGRPTRRCGSLPVGRIGDEQALINADIVVRFRGAGVYRRFLWPGDAVRARRQKRVRSEHAGAGATSGAGRNLDSGKVLFGYVRIGRVAHRGHQAQPSSDGSVDQGGPPAFHRTTGYEHRRDVEAQCGHQHSRRDLVTVGDAHEAVGAVRIDHVLHRTGDQFPRRQRIEHASVAHGDSVVDRNGVELPRNHARPVHCLGCNPPHGLEVSVTWHELGEAVGDRHDRFADVAIRDPEARNNARAPAMFRPWVMVRERSSGTSCSSSGRLNRPQVVWPTFIGLP